MTARLTTTATFIDEGGTRQAMSVIHSTDDSPRSSTVQGVREVRSRHRDAAPREDGRFNVGRPTMRKFLTMLAVTATFALTGCGERAAPRCTLFPPGTLAYAQLTRSALSIVDQRGRRDAPFPPLVMPDVHALHPTRFSDEAFIDILPEPHAPNAPPRRIAGYLVTKNGVASIRGSGWLMYADDATSIRLDDGTLVAEHLGRVVATRRMNKGERVDTNDLEPGTLIVSGGSGSQVLDLHLRTIGTFPTRSTDETYARAGVAVALDTHRSDVEILWRGRSRHVRSEHVLRIGPSRQGVIAIGEGRCDRVPSRVGVLDVAHPDAEIRWRELPVGSYGVFVAGYVFIYGSDCSIQMRTVFRVLDADTLLECQQDRLRPARTIRLESRRA